MKNKITKFAVAAVIAAAVMLGIYLFTESFDHTARAYAMTDLPDLLYSAKTIHMKGTVYYPDTKNPAKIITSDIEVLADLENQRWRKTAASVTMDKDGTRVTQTKSVCDGSEYELFFNPQKKTASYTKLGEYGRKRLCRQITNSIMYMICGKPEVLDLYKLVGREQINGYTYEIWELVVENDYSSMAMNSKMRTWLSPDTGDTAQVIIWTKNDNNNWTKMAHITTLDRNIDVAEEEFQMNLPDGYEYTNTKETAYANSLGGVTCSSGNDWLEGHILFALQDGSMIACWSSQDPESDKSQKEIFAGLQRGGPLPQLPSVVEKLKISYQDQEIIYVGYHLAYTQKNGRFYEWAIYVANDPIENRLSQFLPYELLYKTNGKKDESCKLAMQADMLIENEGDFQDFVLSAMAELSDNGTASELTYQTVLGTAEQIKSR